MEEYQYDSFNTYLMNPKTGEIIGIHAIGMADEEMTVHELDGSVRKRKGFQAIDKWGNPYDKFLNFTGNSFRVHNFVEDVVMEFINDGWVDLDTDKVQKFQNLTVELLKHKYLYYEKNAPIITDYEYDMKERDWIQLGMDIGLDMENYPNWVDFDRNHPQAYQAMKIADGRK